MIAIYVALFIGLVCGMVIGATLLRDVIDSVFWWRKPTQKPRTTVPLARVLHDAQWQRLEIPTLNRQREIRTSLGWESRQ